MLRLLDDIEEHFKAQKQASDKLRYYLGSVILHRDKGNKETTLNIIDGQQRITSLALLKYASDKKYACELSYSSPLSQQQIQKNLAWLCADETVKKRVEGIKFNHLEFTLVITDSADDAYAFFETQNTGGVRLSGPDIIKAHHLRAERENTNRFAKHWEDMGDINPVVDLLMRGRYWQNLDFRPYPSHNQPIPIRSHIVKELAEDTASQGDDVAYSRINRVRSLSGSESTHSAMPGYELRQPLNSGANTIHYLAYFEALRRQYLLTPASDIKEGDHFRDFYQNLICNLDGCGYLKQLFDACMLLYISQFGEDQLYLAALKIFRVTYSRRVENRVAVREISVPSFVGTTPVLDWIALSYTPEQCFKRFDAFELTVTEDGLGEGSKGVKKRFVDSVQSYLMSVGDRSLKLDKESDENKFAKVFKDQLDQRVKS